MYDISVTDYSFIISESNPVFSHGCEIEFDKISTFDCLRLIDKFKRLYYEKLKQSVEHNMKKLCFKCEPFETEKIKECSNKNCGYKDDVDVEGCMSEYQHCCYYYYGECKNKSINGWCSCHINCQYKKMQKEVQKLKQENDILKQKIKEHGKWENEVSDLFMRTCNCKYLDKNNCYCNYYKKDCIAINECLYKQQNRLEKIKETLQDTEYIAQYDGTACDLSLELLQIIEEE